MEVQQSINPLFKYLISTSNINIILLFISFLQISDLEMLVQVLSINKQYRLHKYLITKLVLQKYINRLDRSNFFLFYAQSQFKSIQTKTLNSLVANQFNAFQNSYWEIKTIMQSIIKHGLFNQKNQQLNQFLDNLFFQPDLPLPKMKRQTIAMYSESPLQQLLAMKWFQQQNVDGQWREQLLIEMQYKLLQQSYQQLTAEQIQKIGKTMYQGWLINARNYQHFLIENINSHNLVVHLFAICSTLVEIYSKIIHNIGDPFMKYIQFGLRSSIYRNIICTTQDKFAFVFKHYTTKYNQTTGTSKPKFSFFRNAMSIWAQNMAHFHKQNQPIWNYITSHLRQNKFLEYLQIKTDKLPSVYSELRNEAQLIGFSISLKEQAYDAYGGCQEIEGFFENNLELYEILAKDYLQYQIDICINQITVHWCGHSRHAISQTELYQHFKSFMSTTQKYYQYLIKLVGRFMPADLKLGTLRDIIKGDLAYIDNTIAKPVTIRQAVELANDIITKAAVQWAEKDEKQLIFGQQRAVQYRITPQFQQKDDLLQYFSSKSSIPNNCLPQVKFYYHIQLDRNIEPPKQVDEDSEHEQHEIYESDQQMKENL